MLLCEVVGTVIATAKAEGFRGSKLLLVQPRREDGTLVDEVFVATDHVGAGTGELVLVTRGSAARTGLVGDVPTDAAIVAIVDSVERGNQTPNQKRLALEASSSN